MTIEWTDPDELIDPKVQCSDCDAVCCRLTVIVFPEDQVPRWMVEASMPASTATRINQRPAAGQSFAPRAASTTTSKVDE